MIATRFISFVQYHIVSNAHRQWKVPSLVHHSLPFSLSFYSIFTLEFHLRLLSILRILSRRILLFDNVMLFNGVLIIVKYSGSKDHDECQWKLQQSKCDGSNFCDRVPVRGPCKDPFYFFFSNNHSLIRCTYYDDTQPPNTCQFLYGTHLLSLSQGLVRSNADWTEDFVND